MADEPAKFILGDTAISAIEEPGRRRFFRRKNRQSRVLTHCENCGADLVGHFCAQCGQAAIDYHRSFRYVIVDVLASFLDWDSKVFATIGLLFARPWQLTIAFISGKRVRYLHPARLYLLASLLFFFAVNYWAKSVRFDPAGLTKENRAEIASELNDKDLSPQVRAKVEKALNRGGIKPVPPAKTEEPQPNEEKSKNAEEGSKATLGESPAKGDATKAGEEKEDKAGDYGPFLKLDSGKPSTPFEKWLEERAKLKFGERGKNAQLFFMSMVSNLPYMMLCSIPLFALILKILYIRRRIFYIDHLIYAFHIHTFAYVGVMLIGLITLGLNRINPGTLTGWIIGLLWFTFVIQIFLSIRRVYRQGWIKTFLKFSIGGIIYFFILTTAFVATFFITLAT